MISPQRKAIVLLVSMLLAALLAIIAVPTKRMADSSPLNLGRVMPESFGPWKIEQDTAPIIVDPQQAEVLQRIYSQTLTRVYIHRPSGKRIMLSIAYGGDQRDSMQIHYPEVCYPAQGFDILSSRIGRIDTAFGPVPIRQLETRLNRNRLEPVSYWVMIGRHLVLSKTDKKIAEMRYGLRGEIPDGLIFRVSSLGPISRDEFETQAQFVRELMSALSPEGRLRLAGLVDSSSLSEAASSSALPSRVQHAR